MHCIRKPFLLPRILKHARLLYNGGKIRPISMSYNLFANTDTLIAEEPPVVVMHGLFGSKNNWRLFCRTLQEKFLPNRKIFAVDARNHGESPHTNEHSYLHMAEDVVHLLREQDIKRATVMGHSMGGKAMMVLALKYPNLVERAIFIDISPVYMPKEFFDCSKIFDAMQSIKIPSEYGMAKGRMVVETHMRKIIDSKETASFITQNLKKLENGQFSWIANINALQKNFKNILDFPIGFSNLQYRGPVLFVGGSNSGFIKPFYFDSTKKYFPKAELEYIDSGHNIHLENPEELVKSVLNFFKT